MRSLEMHRISAMLSFAKTSKVVNKTTYCTKAAPPSEQIYQNRHREDTQGLLPVCVLITDIIEQLPRDKVEALWALYLERASTNKQSVQREQVQKPYGARRCNCH